MNSVLRKLGDFT